MRYGLKSALAGVLCGATVLSALPSEVLAGPISAAPPSTVGLSAPVDQVHYRRYRGYRYGYRGGYYRRGYGYDPGGAIFAGAALGLLGAGIAAASRPRYYGYGYPYYGGYGYGYPGYYGGGWGGGWGGWGW